MVKPATLTRPTPRDIPLSSRDALLTNESQVLFAYDSLEEAFPVVDPGIRPLGTNAIFLIRRPKMKTKGGLHLTPNDRSTEYYNTQVAKVVALGPLCFKTAYRRRDPVTLVERDFLEDWPEGPWFKVGDFVRLPKYVGERFMVPWLHEDFETDPATGRREKRTVKDDVIFAQYTAKDVLGLITGDPLIVKAFYD